MSNDFGQFIERKFLEWQMSTKKRQSIASFAEWLGFSQPLVTQWINGTTKRPNPASTYKLASKLGTEVFDILGIPRPDQDPLVTAILANWDWLTDEEKETFQNITERAAARHAEGNATT